MDRDFPAANLLFQGYAVAFKVPLVANTYNMEQQKAAIPVPLSLAQKEWSGQLYIGHDHVRKAQGPVERLAHANNVAKLI